jgi:hypothetical protein
MVTIDHFIHRTHQINTEKLGAEACMAARHISGAATFVHGDISSICNV